MPCLLRELDHFVLDGRAVSGTGSFYNACVNWRAVYVLTNNIVRLFVCVGQKTGDLFDLYICGIRGIGEGNYNFVSLLDGHLGVVEGPSIHSGRSTGLESAKRDPYSIQGILEACGSLHSAGAGLRNRFSDETSGVEISTGTYDRGHAAIDSPGVNPDSGNSSFLCQNLRDFRLSDREIFLFLKNLPHRLGVFGLVRLCPEGVDCRSLGDIEHLGLDKSLINIFAHLAAESIDLSYQMAL